MTSMEEILKQMKAEYLESFSDKTDKLLAALEKEDQAELRELFHKLKGSGKTYGVPEVSELFSVLEELVVSKKYEFKKEEKSALFELMRTIKEKHITEGLTKKNEDWTLQADPHFKKYKKLL